MKRILTRTTGLLLFFVLLAMTSAYAQSNLSLTSTRDTTIKHLKLLRDNIKTYPHTKTYDSLITNISSLIKVSKVFTEQAQLNSVNVYCSNARAVLSSGTGQQLLEVSRQINRDLGLKLKYMADNPLHSGAGVQFAKAGICRVQASIDGGVLPKGKFRLHSVTFLGEDQKMLITAKKTDGGSNTFSNPYNLPVMLPGYITFWLEDTASHSLYKPDFLYKTLGPADTSLNINFTKLK